MQEKKHYTVVGKVLLVLYTVKANVTLPVSQCEPFPAFIPALGKISRLHAEEVVHTLHLKVPYMKAPYMKVPYMKVPYMKVPYMKVPYTKTRDTIG